MPLCEAASCSKKSNDLPIFISSQLLHLLQGTGTGISEDWQLRHFARILARVVLPTPLVPAKIKAWWILS